MGFAHYGHHRNATGGSNRFRSQFGQQNFFVLVRYGGDDVGESGRLIERIFLGDLGF